MADKINIGVVGCGNISGIYFQNLTNVFENTSVYACADLNYDLAKTASEKWNIPHIMTLDEMLSCDEIQLILNITTPQSHYSICKEALESGKHVYVEKPLSLSFEEGFDLLNLAHKNNLLFGCAPDTFMGAGIQTAKELITDDVIGSPIGGVANMLCHGHEGWHPNPSFYYKKGGGPLFDMGPYYITALVTLLGSIKEVSGFCLKAFDQRTIRSKPHQGEKIDVEVNTHVNAMLRFENGAICNLINSFDVWAHSLPKIEIYGTKGSLIVPDPNGFGGTVMLATAENNTYVNVPLTHSYSENSRGIGVANLAKCIQYGGKPLADISLACHVLEIMCAIEKSNSTGEIYITKTKYENNASMPANLVKGQV